MSSAPLVGPPPEPNRKTFPYQGVILFQGLRVLVENLKGSERSGTDTDGKAWRVVMPAHYGEFARTEGADGEPVDVFVGGNRHAHRVFVVHLQDPTTGRHDEDKVFLGFNNADEARDTFRRAYNRRDLQMGALRTMSVSELQEWLKDREKRGSRIVAGRVLSKGVAVLSSIFPTQEGIPEWIGEILFSDDLVKGAGHRYIRRIATGNPRRPWRYYYSVTGGKGIGHDEEFQTGSKFKVAHNGQAGHFEIVGKTASGDLRIKHDETGHESTVSAAVLRDMLHKEHAQAISAHRGRLAGEIKAANGSAARDKLKAEAAKYSHTSDLAKDDKPVSRGGSFHERAAAALGWSVKDAQSGSLQSLRDILRPVAPDLADEASRLIQTGRVAEGAPLAPPKSAKEGMSWLGDPKDWKTGLRPGDEAPAEPVQVRRSALGGVPSNTDKEQPAASRAIAPGLRIVWNGPGGAGSRHGTVKSVVQNQVRVAFDDGTETTLYSDFMSDTYTGNASRMYREADHPGAPFTAEQHAEMVRRAVERRTAREAVKTTETDAGIREETGSGSWTFQGHNYDPKISAADIGRTVKARLRAVGVQARVTSRDGLGKNISVTIESAPFQVFRPEYLKARAEDPHGVHLRYRTRDTQWTPEALEFERKIGALAASYGQSRGDAHNGTYIHGSDAHVYWADTFRDREMSPEYKATGAVPDLPVRGDAPARPVAPPAQPTTTPGPAPVSEPPGALAAAVPKGVPSSTGHAPVKFTGAVVEGATKKTGARVWSVPHEGQIAPGQWGAMVADAETTKGYYLRGSGFTFRDPEHAKAFVAKWGGSGAALNVPTVQAQPSAPVEPRTPPRGPLSEAAKRKPDVSRLRGAADMVLRNAAESLGADRKRDTYRRAQMAAGATMHASAEEATAKTAHRIADAVESGEAVALQGVRSMSDVRTLQGVLAQAKYSAMRRSGESMSGDTLREAVPADIQHAKFPHPVIHHGHARDLIAHVKGRPGTARAIASVEAQVRHASGNDNHFTADTPEIRAHVDTLLDAAKAKGIYGGKGYNADGPRHGQPGHAEHMAKRAATSAVADIVDRSADAKRLEAMGITSTEKLREALHEFHGLRSGARKADPIQVAKDALIGRKIPGYFPTPPKVQARVMALAGVQPGMTVLEPSAGSGHLADAAQAAGGNVATLETNGALRDILKAKGHTVAGTDALTHGEEYDRVVMNPPFEDRQDADHVQHAFERNLKPGGRLVAIMGEGTFFGSDKKAVAFREWLARNGGTSEKLPEGSFQGGDVSTGVSTRVVVLNKPQPGAQAPAAGPLTAALSAPRVPPYLQESTSEHYQPRASDSPATAEKREKARSAAKAYEAKREKAFSVSTGGKASRAQRMELNRISGDARTSAELAHEYLIRHIQAGV